jgi:hypothetical protein
MTIAPEMECFEDGIPLFKHCRGMVQTKRWTLMKKGRLEQGI